MDLDNFVLQLYKLKQSNPDFVFSFGNPLQQAESKLTEDKLQIQIPPKTKAFITKVNGLRTTNPQFELIDLRIWEIKNGLIHFATFDRVHAVCFDTTEINNAGEWNIVNRDSGYVLTLSISSFWSNKIWHWLKHNLKVWADNWWTA